MNPKVIGISSQNFASLFDSQPSLNRYRFIALIFFSVFFLNSSCTTNNNEGLTDANYASDGEGENEACGEAHSLSLKVPDGISPGIFALISFEAMDIGNHSKIIKNSDEYAPIANLGSETTMLGIGTEVGSVISIGDVYLKNMAHVYGNLRTSSEILMQQRYTVDGSQESNTNININYLNKQVTFPCEKEEALFLAPNDVQSTPVPPSYYHEITLKPGASVTLVTGHYFFDEARFEPGSQIFLDDSNGPIYIYIRDQFDLKGDFLSIDEFPPQVLIGYLGSSDVELKGLFSGSLLAPNATVRLVGTSTGNQTSPDYSGAFIAKKILVDPNVQVRHYPFNGWFINSVEFDKEQVCVGGSIGVSVNLTPGSQGETYINGMQGSERILQLSGLPIRQPLAITFRSHDISHTESQIVFADVIDCPDIPTPPQIFIKEDLFEDYVVDLAISNHNTFPANTTYHWSFGDGTSEVTETPMTRHSYFNAINLHQPWSNFEVSVSVQQTGADDIVGAKTISISSLYALQKQNGYVIPPTTETQSWLRNDGNDKIGNYTVRNIEPQPLQITKKITESFGCDGSTSSQQIEDESVNIVIDSQETRTFELRIPSSNINSNACVIATHLMGESNDGLKVIASAYFDVVENMQIEPASPAMNILLNQVFNDNLLPNLDIISEKDLLQLAVDGQIVYPPGSEDIIPFQATSGDVGDPCEPGEAAPRIGLVCQPTGQWDQLSKPNLANALKGDIVLSHACSEIGGALSTIGQHYTHTGIMVEDFDMIRHTTGSVDWLQTHPNSPLEDEPDDAPTDGFKEWALRYMWPGTLTATVEEAFFKGKKLFDADGYPYNVSEFNRRMTQCQWDDRAIFPAIIKPPPSESTAQTRQALHNVAEASKNFEGHYRFAVYSQGSMTMSSDYNANTDCTDEADPDCGWADGSVATVCSSFVWRAAKDSGAVVDPDRSEGNTKVNTERYTRDGLFFYNEQERSAAAAYFWATFYEKVQKSLAEEAGGFDWLFDLFSDISEDVANQVTNCFAFDDCDEIAKDHRNWENPGTGITVSPHDMIHWDPPSEGGLWGYQERAIIRGKHWTQKYAWAPSEGTGSVEGNVRIDGTPIVNAWVRIQATLPDGTLGIIEIVTDSTGHFFITGVPAGTMAIEASKIIGDEPGKLFSTNRCEASFGDCDINGNVWVRASETSFVELNLTSSLVYRRVVLSGSMEIWDDEDWGATEFGEQPVFYEFLPDLVDTTESRVFSFCVGEEVVLKVEIKVTYLNEEGQVAVDSQAWLYEGDSCDTDDEDGYIINARQILSHEETQPVTFHIFNTDEGGDQAWFEVEVFNGVQ